MESTIQKNTLKMIKEYIEENGLKSNLRKREKYIYPRSYLYAYLRYVYDFSYDTIGDMFDKNHATVINGLNVFNNFKRDPYYNAVVLNLKNMFPFAYPDKEHYELTHISQYYGKNEFERICSAKFLSGKDSLESFVREAVMSHADSIIKKHT